jgi:hypothetical protein
MVYFDFEDQKTNKNRLGPVSTGLLTGFFVTP